MNVNASFIELIEKNYQPMLRRYFDPTNSGVISQIFLDIALRWFKFEERRLDFLLSEECFWKHPAFHGFLSWDEAESLLSGKQVGTYLISATSNLGQLYLFYMNRFEIVKQFAILIVDAFSEYEDEQLLDTGKDCCWVSLNDPIGFKNLSFDGLMKGLHFATIPLSVVSRNQPSLPSLRALCTLQIWKHHQYNSWEVKKVIPYFMEDAFVSSTTEEVFRESWFPFTLEQWKIFSISF